MQARERTPAAFCGHIETRNKETRTPQHATGHYGRATLGLLISGSGVRVPVRPPIISRCYDGIAPSQGGFFMLGTQRGTRFAKVVSPGWKGLVTGGGLLLCLGVLDHYTGPPMSALEPTQSWALPPVANSDDLGGNYGTLGLLPNRSAKLAQNMVLPIWVSHGRINSSMCERYL